MNKALREIMITDSYSVPIDGNVSEQDVTQIGNT